MPGAGCSGGRGCEIWGLTDFGADRTGIHFGFIKDSLDLVVHGPAFVIHCKNNFVGAIGYEPITTSTPSYEGQAVGCSHPIRTATQTRLRYQS